MFRIMRKEALRPKVTLYEIEAPLVARKAQPGQFIILRVDENGERIPITIHDYDREKGTVTIIVQTAGATTEKLKRLNEGDSIQDFVGPLGKATETEGKKKVCIVGGGVGCAIAYPVLKKFHESGADLYITEIDDTEKEADVFFPAINKDVWEEKSRECHSTDEKHLYSYSFVNYERID